MPITPAAIELLGDLAPLLNRWGRWYLFGAQAVVAYGVPRLSADVDVTIRLAPERATEFVGDMDRAGFDLMVSDEEFVRRTRVLPFVHRATGMPVDVVLAGSGLEEEFLERAAGLRLGAVTIPVISREDLVVAKILAAARRISRTPGDSGGLMEVSSTANASSVSFGCSRRRSVRAICSLPSVPFSGKRRRRSRRRQVK